MTTKQTAMEVDTAFLKSRRGIVKVTEMVTLFVAFVCFAVASTPKYIAATALEFFITSLLLVLYLLKLNKRLTFFFWPLVGLSFISFVCFAGSSAAAFVTVPLLAFLASLFLLFGYSTKFNERFKGFCWPLTDFIRCVTASIIFFIISIMAVSRYSDGSSKAAGIFGFIATIVFAVDFYFIFNELASFLKQGGESNEEPSRQQDEFSDSDSD
uniref:CKLF-like MARVEL transmembrane domain containing 3 n=1 Tax=Haplochromis burtoni TaxID=8153 RepID=A0A3Q2WBL1_HAPBU